jgi:3'5'-cyclic nucleotide phosphodiesterase
MEINQETIIKSLFDRSDRKDLTKDKILSILNEISGTFDLDFLSERLSEHFRLEEDGVDWENFKYYIVEEFNAAKMMKMTPDFSESSKASLIEVVLALEDIKARCSDMDQKKIEWCISQILSRSSGCEVPIFPSRSTFLRKETFSHIEEYSNLSSLKLALSDEETSRNSVKERLTINTPTEVNLDIQLPQSFFDVDDFDINIFEIEKEIGGAGVLALYSYKIFLHWDLFNSMGIPVQVFLRYVSFIGEGYKDNPYHNILHAADVLQASHILLLQSNFYEIADLSPFHVLALLLSAIVHDYKHPGLNNSFLLLTGHKLAIRYNDTSILENYHVSKAFGGISKDTLNIFSNISKEEYRIIRKLMIKAIVDTDMSKHSRHINDIQSKFYINSMMKNEKDYVVCTLLHMSDLSNPCRKQKISFEWGLRISDELFLQGDKEKELGLEISPFCDRSTLNIAKSQIGFISGVILPYINPLCKLAPQLSFIQNNAEENKQWWTERIAEFQK